MKVNDPYYILFYTCVTSTNILLSLNLQKIIQEGQIFRGRSLTGILPLSTTQWESMVETHLARYPNKGRTMDGLKRKFKELHIKRIPTGDPHCPSDVRRANQLRNAIIELMDGSDLNSPARSTRTDAAGMGGERGESSGGSDDVADNQEYKDTGVEDAPTETIDGSDTPMGEQAHRLPPTVASRGQRGSTAISSTATSSNNRRRTSTHNTPISRPRNQHRESSPEDPGNRVGNVTAMMMMSQAQFRDERREEGEERCQEFRYQVKMHCQQMQNQQDMMAMIMMSMMGRNASGSVPNDHVVNMFAGSSSTAQRNDGEGSNSNTQE
jgi:hypothetical protein